MERKSYHIDRLYGKESGFVVVESESREIVSPKLVSYHAAKAFKCQLMREDKAYHESQEKAGK